jgi:hypothetical protein
LIVRQQDGRIVYQNPEFNALFPDAGRRVDELLAAAGGTPAATAAHITDGIRQGVAQDVPLALVASGQKRLSLVMSMQCIRRPAGFMLLRCREGSGQGQ